MRILILIILALTTSSCAELVVVGQTLVTVGKVAEHLLEYHKPASPTPSPFAK